MSKPASNFSLLAFLKKIYNFYKPFFGIKKNKKWHTLSALLMIIISALLALTMNVINNTMVDFVEVLGQPTVTYSAYFTALNYFLGAILLYSGLNLVNTWIASWLGESLSFAISKKITSRWMKTGAYYGNKLLPNEKTAKNISKKEEVNFAQVISRDTGKLNREVLELGNSFLSTSGNFIVGSIGLYAMSVPLHITLFSASLTIPGYLLISTLIYAVTYNYISKKTSQSLRKGFDKNNQLESNFFHQIEHVQVRAEPIAFYRGANYELRDLINILNKNRMIQRSIINIRSALNFLISFHYNFSTFVSFILASPSVIAGKLNMSSLFSLSNHFSFIVTFFTWESVNFDSLTECDVRLQNIELEYEKLAKWKELKKTNAAKLTHTDPTAKDIHLELSINTPAGAPLLQNFNAKIPKGKRTLLTGNSGVGKTATLRTLRKINPYAQGKIKGLPEDTIYICAEPYFPRNKTLLEAIFYPRTDPVTKEEKAEVEKLMRDLNFSEDKIAELEQVKDWNTIALSDGEKKRIMLINALMKNPKPSTLIMDEATRGIDAKNKQIVEQTLLERLPGTTIIFTDHNPSDPPFHQRQIKL